ncbi:bifunctional diaminohydroxyphosphoribosylaminopyrimidine deaminase/5-amino-6-(5-phosphoribosylamino)uracil reductase RibD [Jannaschia sp. Os4]|nr:bifunctional diaminohydroxyphosphoribosylaminopyrimidine deaminase/5-amino-6-(5-phosphoribosylamino)uracil reductase RibD [Jannaschia sp. Os4]MBM2577817.1 bifunctional diaminohydroxyphosphoribosylaminopyrimidine deaminase/5-amino-6-(5-phosphoribosylamino)uracil reductase RibD [Jannaschia sp. Os4]
MAAALALGRRGQGRCAPNPAVGCVIVADGRVVGRGRTADGGRPHAETVALAQAGDAARGAAAYVTLEPCAHHGATPPCAGALAAAGVARVVVALRDPDPRVDGGGLARLRAAGVEVVEGVGADAAARDLSGFLSRVTRGRPALTLKLATTLDGRIATASGESRWITGAAARAHVHAQRARHDAVMVGAGTLRADDPLLTVRGMGDVPQPARVVLSRRLDLPPGRMEAGAGKVPMHVLYGSSPDPTAHARLTAAGAIPTEVAEGDGGLDPQAVMSALGDLGFTRVYCEGGGTLAAALLRAGLVDRLDHYVAGAAIGAEGVPGVGPLALAALADAPRLELVDVRRIGADALLRWKAKSS